MTEQELRQLALDMVEGKVFGTWDLPEDHQHLIGNIWMVLILGGADILTDDVAHVYEYLDKAGPRSVNGYPIFWSCRVLTKEDAKKLSPLIDKLEKQREAFLGEEPPEKQACARCTTEVPEDKGQICRVCNEWVCDNCTAYEHMKEINTEDMICRDCMKKEETVDG